MWNKFFFSILTVLILIFHSNLFGEDANFLEWEEIEGAKGYRIQIEDKKKNLLIDERLKSEKFLLELPTGEYRYRIGVYNKLDKISGYSEWVELNIVKSLIPKLKSKPMKFDINEIPETITVKGENFSTETKVELISGDLTYELEIQDLESTSDLKLKLDKKIIKVGEYDLIFKNPKNKNLRVNRFLEFYDKSEAIMVMETETETKTGEIIKELYPYWGSGLRSAILPGWGQYQKDQKIKGYFFSAGVLIGIGGVISSYQNFKSAKSDYQNYSNYGYLLTSYSGSEAENLMYLHYFQSNSRYDSALNRGTGISTISKGVAVFYLLNILDALFWKKSYPDSQAILPRSPEYGLHIFQDISRVPLSRSPGSLETEVEFGLGYNF